jgi:hypothetical protein
LVAGLQLGLLAELVQAEPNHAIEEGLQLERQLGWAEFDAPLGQPNENRQMQHLGMPIFPDRGQSTPSKR